MKSRNHDRSFRCFGYAGVGLVLASGCVASVSGGADDHGGMVDASVADGTVDASPGKFTAGDPFDYSLVDRQSQMVSTMLTGLGYMTSTAPRAVAINPDGLGYVSVQPTGTANDVARTALQACFVIGGGRPCALLASGATFQIGANALAIPSSYLSTLSKPAALTDIPFVPDSVRSGALAQYGAKAGFKAIAIGFDGTAVFVPDPQPVDVIGSQAEANRVALERCEMQSISAPCTLFASGNTVVLDPAVMQWTPAIDYTRTAIQTNVPGMTAANYNAHMTPYLTGVTQGSQGVTYIAEDGDGGNAWTTTQAAADSQALAFCNGTVGAGSKCFRYAIDRSVVMSPSNLDAIRNHSLALHCSAMPRQDCATHKLMGCTTSGMYYTTHAGGVTVEACSF